MKPEMIEAHRRAIVANHDAWSFWLCGFTAGKFQQSIGKVLLASDGFRDAMQKLSDVLSRLGPLDDDDEETT